MDISCNVSEICSNIGRELQNFRTLPIFNAPVECVTVIETRMTDLPCDERSFVIHTTVQTQYVRESGVTNRIPISISLVRNADAPQ